MTIPRKTVAQSDEVDDTDKSCQIASWHWKILPERELALENLARTRAGNMSALKCLKFTGHVMESLDHSMVW